MLRNAVLLVLFLALATTAGAQIPYLINYQGRLSDATDSPIDGPILMKFVIYGSESDADSLWWSGFQSVQVDEGLFEYQLGSISAIPHDLFTPGFPRYLGITVNTDAEIAPRTQLVSSAFAFLAHHAEAAITASELYCTGCITTTLIDNASVTSTKLAPNSVFSSHIAPDEVETSDLAHGAVTTEKIEDGTIRFQDIQSNGATDGDVMKWNGTSWEADDCIPAGMIMMWSGSLASIPDGWALCNGSSGTPNLSDRFVYSVSNGENPGASGGMTTHNHLVNPPQVNSNGNSLTTPVGAGSGTVAARDIHDHVVDIPSFTSADGSSMPPYYKLAFVMKL